MTVMHTQLRPVEIKEVRYNRQNLETLRYREMHKVSLGAESCSHLPIVPSDQTVLEHGLSLVLVISVPKIVLRVPSQTSSLLFYQKNELNAIKYLQTRQGLRIVKSFL